ncbi:MAG TPA: hydroxymethylglutaryl-CoA lyase [Flavisolibacter sp.]
MEQVHLVECPRDAMQGWKGMIPTAKKIEYLNALLQVGFDTLDFGSFVSPKAIPQMADTPQVVDKLQVHNTRTKLLAIVANVRGAEDAVQFDAVQYLGFPFSVSPTFQLRNTNSTMEESIGRVEAIQDMCMKHNRRLVVYLSMGFGNPYGDPYNEEVLLHWADQMVQRGIGVLSLADTVGMASPAQITFALETLLPKYPATTIGVHLHAAPSGWQQKFDAAFEAGCRRFDGALKGIGGCPMAQDDLVGNMDTELMIRHLHGRQLVTGINFEALGKAMVLAGEIFQKQPV